jgi:hypothetical protein
VYLGAPSLSLKGAEVSRYAGRLLGLSLDILSTYGFDCERYQEN